MASNKPGLIFRPLFEHLTCTYTYLLGCPKTREALIIDPVIETVDRDLQIIKDLELKLIYAANTHVHADHVTGSGALKKYFPVKSVVSALSGGKADVLAKHGDKLRFGEKEVEVRATPGHTNGCTTFVAHEDRMAFTGDALLIRGCGRTDFQQGNPGVLYDSVHQHILSLPPDFKLFPGHDYKGHLLSTVEEELKHNKRLVHSKEEFIKIMDNLNLATPKYLDKSLPANFVDGILEDMDEKTREIVENDLKKYKFP
jgi:sulfur dioxygenase